MTPLALIRHGPTEWNRLGRIQGRTDIPLDAEGREAVASWTLPADMEGYRWVASPLKRTLETARILGVEASLEPALVEMNWGRWEGKSMKELGAELDADTADDERQGLDLRRPDGESPRDVQRRLAPWLAAIAVSGQATAAVTHKGVIRAVYAWPAVGT
jgi:broad specificity phosphatase PhoE